MKKVIKPILVLVLFQSFVQAKMTGRQIMEKQKDLHKVSSEVEIQKMLLVDKSGNKESRILKRYVKESGKDLYKVMMAFMEPANIKGTAMLTWQHKDKEDDQWLYLPAQGKMQRIAKAGQKNYFLGTDFTYEDLKSEDPNDYKYTIVKEDKCGKKKEHDCYFIEAISINKKKLKASGYGKRVLEVRKDIMATITTTYYSKRGKKIKTQTTDGWYKLKGTVWRAKRAMMDNHKKKHKTLVGTVSLKADEKIDDKVFLKIIFLKVNIQTKANKNG